MTNQATPDYNTALADARKATQQAQALAADWQATADRQRDQLITLLAARSAADREVGHLTGERDELKRQLAELSQLVGAETPIAAFTLAQTWYAEKAGYQAEIAALMSVGRDTLVLLESYKAGDGLHTTINIWDDMIARWKGHVDGNTH